MSERTLAADYKMLLAQEWKGQPLWQHIASGEDKNRLASVPALKGELYDGAEERLMFVGRSLNGWGAYNGDCSEEAVLDSILNHDNGVFKNAMSTEGFESGGKRRYFYCNSRFWKLIHEIYFRMKLANEKWVECEWGQRFVWGNIYCISPVNKGNPSWNMIKPSLPIYVDILKNEIEMFKPKTVIMITKSNHKDKAIPDEYDGWLLPWKNKELAAQSFWQQFHMQRIDDECEYVFAEGEYDGAKIIVVKRPDARFFTNDLLTEMALEITTYLGLKH